MGWANPSALNEGTAVKFALVVCGQPLNMKARRIHSIAVEELFPYTPACAGGCWKHTTWCVGSLQLVWQESCVFSLLCEQLEGTVVCPGQGCSSSSKIVP